MRAVGMHIPDIALLGFHIYILGEKMCSSMRTKLTALIQNQDLIKRPERKDRW